MIHRLLFQIFLAILAFAAHTAQAECRRTNFLSTEDGKQASIAFGSVALTDSHLQPAGTLLASTVVPATNFTATGANADTVIWTCDTGDKGNIYFLYAVNGRDRLGGYHNMSSTAGGVKNVYATYFQNVGLRLSVQGIPVTRNWQPIQVSTYEIVGTKIHIRLRDVPPLQAELYKISGIPALTGAPNNGCYAQGAGGMGIATSGTLNYACWVANAYVQLWGPGITHDDIGYDTGTTDMVGIAAFNGFAYGMRNASTITSQNTCRVAASTSSVQFADISLQELQQGQTRQEPFDVQLECSTSVPSGTATGQTAIGIQASAGAIAAASELGLVTGSGAVTHLLSDNYLTDSNLAKGVGISLKNARSQRDLLFLGANLNTGAATAGETGWYPVLEGSRGDGSSGTSGFELRSHQFLATLSRLPGQAVKSGKVQATAFVQVRIQ